MTQLTDEQIDQLSGRELRETVCLAMGWTREGESGELLRSPGGNVRGWYDLPKPHTDLGAAMGLLSGINASVWVNMRTDGFVDVWLGLTDKLASGPKESAAETICRAWLKIKNRS